MRGHLSPYYAPDFYTQALASGRHRDIVGGRWNETGEAQMALLTGLGLQPHHHLLDIGCGSLRLGCKAVPFLDPGHYWGTDMSAALMRRGYETELADKARLPPAQLIEDAAFDFPGVPEVIDHAISFAVFTHLPLTYLEQALGRLRSRFPRLEWLCFTVFLAPDAALARGPVRQPDGVVTHPDRAPYHLLADDVARAAAAAGFALAPLPAVLPRGQAAFVARPC